MTSAVAVELLAVVEVPRSERVYCQHNNCKRPVFRRIHVIRRNGGVTFVGSGCYQRYYAELASRRLESVAKHEHGVRLTLEQVRLLVENTEKLLAILGARFAHEVPSSIHQSAPHPHASDSELWQYALDTTKQVFREQKGINPDLPGWRGWVNREAKKLLQKLKNDRR